MMWFIDPNMSYLAEEECIPKPIHGAAILPIPLSSKTKCKIVEKEQKTLKTISSVYANMEKTDEELSLLNQSLAMYIGKLIDTQKNITKEESNCDISTLNLTDPLTKPATDMKDAVKNPFAATKGVTSVQYFRPFVEENTPAIDLVSNSNASDNFTNAQCQDILVGPINNSNSSKDNFRHDTAVSHVSHDVEYPTCVVNSGLSTSSFDADLFSVYPKPIMQYPIPNANKPSTNIPVSTIRKNPDSVIGSSDDLKYPEMAFSSPVLNKPTCEYGQVKPFAPLQSSECRSSTSHTDHGSFPDIKRNYQSKSEDILAMCFPNRQKPLTEINETRKVYLEVQGSQYPNEWVSAGEPNVENPLSKDNAIREENVEKHYPSYSTSIHNPNNWVSINKNTDRPMQVHLEDGPQYPSNSWIPIDKHSKYKYGQGQLEEEGLQYPSNRWVLADKEPDKYGKIQPEEEVSQYPSNSWVPTDKHSDKYEQVLMKKEDSQYPCSNWVSADRHCDRAGQMDVEEVDSQYPNNKWVSSKKPTDWQGQMHLKTEDSQYLNNNWVSVDESFDKQRHVSSEYQDLLHHNYVSSGQLNARQLIETGAIVKDISGSLPPPCRDSIEVRVHQEQYYQAYYRMLQARSKDSDNSVFNWQHLHYSTPQESQAAKNPENVNETLQSTPDTPPRSTCDPRPSRNKVLDPDQDSICQNILKRYHEYKKNIVSEIPEVGELLKEDSKLQIPKTVLTYGEYKRSLKSSNSLSYNTKERKIGVTDTNIHIVAENKFAKPSDRNSCRSLNRKVLFNETSKKDEHLHHSKPRSSEGGNDSSNAITSELKRHQVTRCKTDIREHSNRNLVNKDNKESSKEVLTGTGRTDVDISKIRGTDREKSDDSSLSQKWDPLKSRYGRRPNRDMQTSEDISTNPFSPFCPNKGIKEKPLLNINVKERDPAASLSSIFQKNDKEKTKGLKHKNVEDVTCKDKPEFSRSLMKKIPKRRNNDSSIADPAISFTDGLVDSTTCGVSIKAKDNVAETLDHDSLTVITSTNDSNKNEEVCSDITTVNSNTSQDTESTGKETHVEDSNAVEKSVPQLEPSEDLQSNEDSINLFTTENDSVSQKPSSAADETKFLINENQYLEGQMSTDHHRLELSSERSEDSVGILNENVISPFEDVTNSVPLKSEVGMYEDVSSNVIEDSYETSEEQFQVKKEMKVIGSKEQSNNDVCTQISDFDIKTICKNRVCKLVLVDVFWKAKRDGKFKKSRLQRLTRKFMKKYNSKLKKAQSFLSQRNECAGPSQITKESSNSDPIESAVPQSNDFIAIEFTPEVIIKQESECTPEVIIKQESECTPEVIIKQESECTPEVIIKQESECTIKMESDTSELSVEKCNMIDEKEGDTNEFSTTVCDISFNTDLEKNVSVSGTHYLHSPTNLSEDSSNQSENLHVVTESSKLLDPLTESDAKISNSQSRKFVKRKKIRILDDSEDENTEEMKVVTATSEQDDFDNVCTNIEASNPKDPTLISENIPLGQDSPKNVSGDSTNLPIPLIKPHDDGSNVDEHSSPLKDRNIPSDVDIKEKISLETIDHDDPVTMNQGKKKRKHEGKSQSNSNKLKKTKKKVQNIEDIDIEKTRETKEISSHSTLEKLNISDCVEDFCHKELIKDKNEWDDLTADESKENSSKCLVMDSEKLTVSIEKDETNKEKNKEIEMTIDIEDVKQKETLKGANYQVTCDVSDYSTKPLKVPDECHSTELKSGKTKIKTHKKSSKTIILDSENNSDKSIDTYIKKPPLKSGDSKSNEKVSCQSEESSSNPLLSDKVPPLPQKINKDNRMQSDDSVGDTSVMKKKNKKKIIVSGNKDKISSRDTKSAGKSHKRNDGDKTRKLSEVTFEALIDKNVNDNYVAVKIDTSVDSDDKPNENQQSSKVFEHTYDSTTLATTDKPLESNILDEGCTSLETDTERVKPPIKIKLQRISTNSETTTDLYNTSGQPVDSVVSVDYQKLKLRSDIKIKEVKVVVKRIDISKTKEKKFVSAGKDVHKTDAKIESHQMSKNLDSSIEEPSVLDEEQSSLTRSSLASKSSKSKRKKDSTERKSEKYLKQLKPVVLEVSKETLCTDSANVSDARASSSSASTATNNDEPEKSEDKNKENNNSCHERSSESIKESENIKEYSEDVVKACVEDNRSCDSVVANNDGESSSDSTGKTEPVFASQSVSSELDDSENHNKCTLMIGSNVTDDEEVKKSVVYTFLHEFGKSADSSDSSEVPSVCPVLKSEPTLPVSLRSAGSCTLIPLPVIDNVLSELDKSLIEIEKTPNTFLDESSDSVSEDVPFLKNLDTFLTNLEIDEDETNVDCFKNSNVKIEDTRSTISENSSSNSDIRIEVATPSTVKTKAELKAIPDMAKPSLATEKSIEGKSNFNPTAESEDSTSCSASSSNHDTKVLPDGFFDCVYCQKRYCSSKSKAKDNYSKNIVSFCENCFLMLYKKKFSDYKRKIKAVLKRKRKGRRS